MEKETMPLGEFYDDDMINLSMFFSNGKKEFWRFDKIRKKGIDKCVFFFPRDFRKLKNIYSKCRLVYQFKSASTISPVYLYKNKVLIALCPLGGPAAANLMEELIFAGITKFVGTGSCGAIKDIDLDRFFIATRAIRDEGTSYHYLPASKYVETSPVIFEALKKVLSKHHEKFDAGTIWTTDAMYRETPKRIAQRLKDGATCVDMEDASLSAVAKARGVDYGCLLYYSDYNSGKEWKTRIYDKFALREKIINYAVETLELL